VLDQVHELQSLELSFKQIMSDDYESDTVVTS